MAWAGKILRVNLTKGTCTSEPLNMKWAREYVGQRGLATKYFTEEVDAKVDPLSPANKIIWATGPAHRDDGLDRRALLGHHQGPAHRRDRLLELGRLLGRRAQDGRLGHDHLRGQVAQARLPLHRGRQGAAARRRLAVGQDGVGDRARPQGQAPGSADPRQLHRPRRRDGLPVRRGGQRPAPRRRTLRRGHRHGQQEPQGDRGARDPGRRQPPRPGGLHEGGDGGEEGAGRQRGHRAGPAQVRHAGADERHQRDRRHADAQPPRRAVRGREGHLGRSDARAAQDRRQAEPGDQPGVLRLHHRLRPDLQDRRDALHGAEPPAVLGRVRRAGVRGGVGAGLRQRRQRPRGAHLRQLHLQRGRLRPDLVRRHRRRGDGALPDGRADQGAARHRGPVRLGEGADLLRRDHRQGRGLRQGDRARARSASPPSTAIRTCR